ncbi:hypothetical protein HSBAA_53310 [Vreelandella sulfidaeris]|uniref:Phytoene synthase n=1 Tax=Vreelandella sulfidaeris TaxID=115553 RepID=A0A455UDA3_9GAMM|nr:hypothetical protein HSBAA_53310 [Halomonas sulfidaeris]
MNQPLLDHATRTMAVGSKSFDTAAKLFDADTRRSALMLYAWCRHCDDVIDDQTLGFNIGTASATNAQERLASLEAQTRQAYAGEPMEAPAFAAFQEVALKHGIPPRRAFEHLEGFAMDVRDEHYTTFEDTLRYCYHVAGVVGLMMAQVMGVRDERCWIAPAIWAWRFSSLILPETLSKTPTPGAATCRQTGWRKKH